MNQTHLARRLGVVSSPAFQRLQNYESLQSIKPEADIFSDSKDASHETSHVRGSLGTAFNAVSLRNPVAHPAGTNCLTIDQNTGRVLVSGGADATVHLWDLEASQDYLRPFAHRPAASLTKTVSGSHTHAVTALSIYPFDPTPSTLITSSYDKSVKLTSITSTSLTPVHTFPLEFVPYTISLSPVTSSSPLVAVGTAHPAIRLLDLRSGLGTHSLPGHNGAIYSLRWSPKLDHILASSSTDGRVLLFDIRRANAAFASLDLDDAIGVVGEDVLSGLGARKPLDWNARAHSGPVTSVQWTANGDKLLTAGHDQRLRVWDAATGRNDLVHFGPRIRNERVGELKPLVSPLGCGWPGKELLFWPNDDGQGDIYVYNLREGNVIRVLRTPGMKRGRVRQGNHNVSKYASGGRINGMVWRHRASAGGGLELYSAHGDGRICGWTSELRDEDHFEEGAIRDGKDSDLTEQEIKRKRKRDMLGDLVEGLKRKSMDFG